MSGAQLYPEWALFVAAMVGFGVASFVWGLVFDFKRERARRLERAAGRPEGPET